MTKVFGLDVHTSYQPFMDFVKLKDDPDWDMRFVIVKSSEGYGYESARYKEYIQRIKAAGLYTGSYHYFYATDGDTKWEAERQAKYYVDLAGETDLPLVLDLEDSYVFKNGLVSKEKVKDGALWCLDKIEQLSGRTPMLYTGDWYMDLIPKDEKFLHYPLWVASYQYPDKVFPGFLPIMPDDWVLHLTDWAIHQFSTKYRNLAVAKAGFEWPKDSGEWHKSYGGIIPVNCDINRTTEDKLNKLLGIAPPPPTPQPTPEPSDPEGIAYWQGHHDGSTSGKESGLKEGREIGKTELANDIDKVLEEALGEF